MSKKSKTGKYGIKAYGICDMFRTEAEFRKHLIEWMANTDGSERDRAVTAFINLEAGIPFTDTDM